MIDSLHDPFTSAWNEAEPPQKGVMIELSLTNHASSTNNEHQQCEEDIRSSVVVMNQAFA